MGTVQKLVDDGEKNPAQCGLCREPVIWVLFGLGESRTRTMVERCARGAGDVAIEQPLIAFGAEQMPGAYPAGNSNFRLHVCGRPKSFSADGLKRKTRENSRTPENISYRPKGSDNSRGRK